MYSSRTISTLWIALVILICTVVMINACTDGDANACGGATKGTCASSKCTCNTGFEGDNCERSKY